MIMKYLWAIVLLGLIGSHWWVWNHRGQVEEFKRLQAVEDFRKKENQLIKQVQESKKQREVVIRDRIQIIREYVGKCLDEYIPPELLDGLHNDSDSKTKPGTNG